MQWFRNRHVRGRPPHQDVLTPAEWRVLEHLRAGRSNPEIAIRLHVSVNTVRTHVSSMLAKLELSDRHELAAWDGEPQEASRVALARFALAGPLGWVREGSWVGKTAAGVSVVAISVAAVVVFWGLNNAVGGGAIATPTPPATVTVTETPAVEPTPDAGTGGVPFAPDGRTGEAAIDDLIEALLNDDADTLAQRFAGVAARDWSMPEPDFDQELVLDPVEWSARLASSSRALYSVTHGHSNVVPPRDIEIMLAVTEGGIRRAWIVAVDDGRIVDLVLNDDYALVSQADRAGWDYGYFVVLPPAGDLPRPPAGHDLATRSGNAGVDALLALIEAGDATGLAALAPDELTLRRCGQVDISIPRQVTDLRLEEITAAAAAVHAVVAVPDGYQPAAAHLVILITQIGPYRWDSAGLFERDGQIVGLYLGCTEHAHRMYPPSAYALAPPADGGESLDPARTSGIAAVDEALAALRVGDPAALDSLVDWQEIECVVEPLLGIGGPPLCEEGEAPGSSIEVIPVSQCEGGPVRRAEMLELWDLYAADDWMLYAVAEIGPPTTNAIWPEGDIDATLFREGGGALALSFSDAGIADVWVGCGPSDPEQLMRPGRTPSFLLPPP